MRCSVVIPCHNGVDLTAACIESLLDQKGRPELEILVVDNASDDGTAGLGKLSTAVRVLPQERNLGFAGGVNAGIRAASAPLVLVLNNDTLAAPNLVQELVRILDQHPDLGAVAPVSNHVKGPALLPIGNLGRDAAARHELASALGEEPPLQDVDTLSGLCLLLPRATLARVGLFDERFGHGNFEDDDFSLRMRLCGMRLGIARRAFLHHEGHATFRSLGLDLREQIAKRGAQFATKWQKDPAGRAVLAAMRGDLQGAAAAAAIARRRWPQWIDAEWHLAQTAAARGESHAALGHLETLLAANPRHSAAAVQRFELLLALGEDAAAQQHLEWTGAHCHLGTELQRRIFTRLGEHLHARGDRAGAQAQFRAALDVAPADGTLHNWIGVCALADHDLDTAERSFHAAIEHGCPIGHTNLGIVHHRRGELSRAAHHFARAAAELPHDPVAAANLVALRSQLAT